MTANKLFTMGAASAAMTAMIAGLVLAVAALALLSAQPAAAAGLDHTDHQAVDQQTEPEPAPPEDGQPDEGPVGEGEAAVADGGSATPWVMLGIGVLLVVALFAAYWVSRKPAATDLEAGATADHDHRYIPPGI